MEVFARSITVTLRGTQWDGFTATATAPTLGEHLTRKSDRQVIELWVDHLLRWNLESDGEPVPMTMEAVEALPDPSLPMSLAIGWLSKATEVVHDRPFADPAPAVNGTAPPPDEVVMETHPL